MLGQCTTAGHHLEYCFCNWEQTLVKSCILKDKKLIYASGRIKLEEAWGKSRKGGKKRRERLIVWEGQEYSVYLVRYKNESTMSWQLLPSHEPAGLQQQSIQGSNSYYQISSFSASSHLDLKAINRKELDCIQAVIFFGLRDNNRNGTRNSSLMLYTM